MKSLILYWSAGGNTKKAADEIRSVLEEAEVSVRMEKITGDLEIDLYQYDLVFFGAPSYQWIPPVDVQTYIHRTITRIRKGVRPVGAPRRSGKFGVVFCTYGGIHTGLKEGIVAGKYMAQFFEHIGFMVLDEWYTPGKFQGWEEGSRNGKLGNILERPDQRDLHEIRTGTLEILQSLDFLRDEDRTENGDNRKSSAE